MLMVSTMAFAQEWSICKTVSGVFIIILIKGARGESSCALWQTAPCREVTVAWILLLQGKQPQWVSERTLAVLVCFCLQEGSFLHPLWRAFHPAMSHMERQGLPCSQRKLLAVYHSCILGVLGTWLLHRPSCPARKPIVCFSNHCPLSPDL